MIACPSCLRGVFRVVQAIGQHVEETRCIAFHAPFIVRIFLSQRTLRLNVLLVLCPVSLAQFTLFLPGPLVPDELQVVLELLTQPHVRTAGTIHAVGIVHILIGDGEEAELAHKPFQLLD